ncbi:MAG: hypothetical protein EOO95_11200 [Pedobacter sp.]|nr:MAG: hypothetical protein EOO95_11200 [Pedobacter sp.]
MKLLATSVLLTIASLAFFKAEAQDSFQISYRVNTNKSVDFDYQKSDPGTFTVLLKFNDLTNSLASREQQITSKNYSGRLLSLTPDNKDNGIGFGYSYTYIRGKLKPKYNPDFLYLIPYKKDVIVRVAESSFVNATYFGSTTPDDWKVYKFFTKTADTVTAIRKGIVVEVRDLHETDESADVAYTSKINDLIIEHSDGTLASYRGFKKGSISVKVGETVLPGSNLGINTKTNGNTFYGVSIMLYYLKSVDFESAKNANLKTSKSLYGIITPHFSTVESADVIPEPQQEYTSLRNPDVVKKELSKKEIAVAIK